MHPGRPPSAQTRGRSRRGGSPCPSGRYSPEVLPSSSRTLRESSRPATPHTGLAGRVSGPYGFRTSPRARRGLRAHRVPFPTPQRLQKRTVLDSTPKPPSWMWNAVSPHPQPSKPAAPPVAESYPPRPGRGDGRGMCGTPRPGLSALRSALPSVPWSLSHRVPEARGKRKPKRGGTDTIPSP